MDKEILEKKLEGRLECMAESLRYQLQSQCELLANIHTIQYLWHLSKDEKINLT